MTRDLRRHFPIAVPALAALAAAHPASADGPYRAWGSVSLGVPANLGRVRLIAASFAGEAAAVCSDGQVRWWRLWSNGAGIDISQVPRDIGEVRQLDLGQSWGLVLRTDGTVRAWGPSIISATIVPSDLGPCSAIAAGYSHALALRLDGSVRTWGQNNFGSTIVPASLGTVVAVETNYLHNVVIEQGGKVVCWGLNTEGSCNPPATLRAVEVGAGSNHSVARRADGTMVGWGQNSYGQCTPPADLGPIVRIAAGGDTTTVMLADGTVRSWGWNSWTPGSEAHAPADLGPCTSIEGANGFNAALPCGLDMQVFKSPNLGNFGAGVPREHLFTGVPATAGGTVEVAIQAAGDLDLTTEFLVVKVDGQTIGTAFNTSGSAGDCPTGLDRAVLQVPDAIFQAAAEDGEVTIRVEPSVGVSATQCGNAALFVSMSVPRPFSDCNSNGRHDACDIEIDPSLDCNRDGAIDSCGGGSGLADCDQDGTPDACQISGSPGLDCDADGTLDSCEIAANASLDCNSNGRLDSCDVSSPLLDCDRNGLVDACEIAANQGLDCNSNGFHDACDVAGTGGPFDCDNDNLVDSCEIAGNPSLDCDSDGTLDSCQLAGGGGADKDADGRIDACEQAYGDLDLNGLIDGADLGALLSVWGLPDPPYGDLTGNGSVDGADLGELLSRWGPVP
jgi:hypothetical protein